MKRWYQIKEYLNLRGVKYDSFQSDGEGSTEVLTKMLINNGYKTIVVVGGDEALNDAVNALMFTPREIRSEIVVGVIPNGHHVRLYSEHHSGPHFHPALGPEYGRSRCRSGHLLK